MSVIINTNFNVNAPVEIDGRLLVDRVNGTTSSLVSLTTGYNYRNMYVWVREEKAFYYLINSPTQGGATSSDWTKLLSGGSASAIDITEVAFGTGTGITSSRNFTFATSNPTLIFGSGSTICSSSPFSAIIGGCNNTIGTASCNSGIFGGCNNNVGTSSQSVIIGGQSNKLFGTTTNSINHSSIIGGQCNTLSATSSQSSIVGGYKNTLSCCSCNSSIIGGKSNCLCISSYNSSIIGGASNKLCFQSCYSSIVGGQCNTLAYFSKFSSVIGGYKNTLSATSCQSSIVGGCVNSLTCYSKYSSIVGGKSNTLARYTSQSSIVGGCLNILCCNSSQSSIVGGQCNTLTCHSCRSSIVGGYKNTLSFTSSHSSIVGGCGNTLSATSSFSSIIGGQSNTLCNNSCNSAIIGGVGLTLSNECSVVYVPKLKIQTVSNVSADRILVWDTDNVVKYRDVSTIGVGSGGGTISLKLNAGLTNSGVTYSTIYNTTVPELTKVPSVRPDATGSSFSLSWLIGLTAGYFSQKNIVEVLDMILFPNVPFSYIQPSVLSISSGSGLFSTLKSVSSTPYTSFVTTNFSKGNAFATASTYNWYCSTGGSYTLVGSPVTSTADSATTALTITFSAITPKTYYICSTVDHQAGTPQPDSSGNPQPGAPSAGTKCSNASNFSIIFPYYFGTVSELCTSILPGDIITCGTRCTLQSSGPIIVNFNTQNPQTKGFLATPQSPVGQSVMIYNKWIQGVTNCGDIPQIGGLFTTISTVANVNVCGISQTYSVYLFSQGSETSGPFSFCCCV